MAEFERGNEMEVYTFKNLTFAYPNRRKPAIDNVSFSVRQGEFVVLCGKSGSGKSTLLHHCKSILSPHGTCSGDILFYEQPIADVNELAQAVRIGFVMQNADAQLVTDKVWHELAFGLENMGLSSEEIRIRVAETASFFGIETWFHKKVSELSGGQKQLVNLAAVMVMQPSALILDEPTGQLDPIAASELLQTLDKLHRETGITIIISEHRLEELLPMADRVLVMEDGKLIFDGAPADIEKRLHDNDFMAAMPTPIRVHDAVDGLSVCPITVRDGRDWLERFSRTRELLKISAKPFVRTDAEEVIVLSDVCFRYKKDDRDILRNLSLTVRRGEIYAVVGGNGVGKTTMLSVMAGLLRPYCGRVKMNSEKIALLPQDPKLLFCKKTLREDLYSVFEDTSSETVQRVTEAVRLCGLSSLLDAHPYDLSGGEQQRAALAKLLLARPSVLLLDEPTKGMDACFKRELGALLRQLQQDGMTIVFISHDLEFCASYSDICAMLFDGGIVGAAPTRQFLSGKKYYTTAANRMARTVLPDAVLPEDIIEACGGEISKPLKTKERNRDIKSQPIVEPPKKKEKKKVSLIRAIGAGISLLAFVLTIWLFSDKWEGWRDLFIRFLSLGELGAAFLFVAGGNCIYPQTVIKKGHKKSMLFAAIVTLIAVPLTVLAGVYFLQDRKYYFISLLVIFELLLSCFIALEGRRPQARELVVIAVLCALAIAGRTIFYMLPQVKPVAAIVILSGVCFGAETGFLVGAVTMLVSNILLGQGPWTPWQMFALGLVGFAAGVLYGKGILRRTKVSLCVFGFLASVIIYGGIMNMSAVLTWQSYPTWAMVFSTYLLGLPFDLLFGLSTAVFLWVLTDPMLEKLERLKEKYGIL